MTSTNSQGDSHACLATEGACGCICLRFGPTVVHLPRESFRQFAREALKVLIQLDRNDVRAKREARQEARH